MSELTQLQGLGPKRLHALAQSGITTLRDLVYHIPRQYIDRTEFRPLKDMTVGDEVYALVDVEEITSLHNRMLVRVSDGALDLDLVFFQGVQYLKGRFRPGQRLTIAGTLAFFRGLQVVHPEFQIVEPGSSPTPQGILPRYPLTEAMAQARVEHKLLQAYALEALEKFTFSDPLPEDLRRRAQLPREVDSLRSIHAPITLPAAAQALAEIKMRELLPLFQAVEKRRRERLVHGFPFARHENLESRLKAGLPFALTPGQESTAVQIASALAAPGQFVGLLQGDVGSGKTIVAVLSALGVLGDGAQIAMLAPTEILAIQHFKNLREWIEPLGFEPALMTGQVQGEARARIQAKLENGDLQVVVGTHALLSEGMVFRRLGFVIIDEQHRFGVKQREAMGRKGDRPHILYLSATPIPRTLAQTLYGEMDVLLLKDKPKGRMPVKTRMVPSPKRLEMLGFLLAEVQKGNQVFWVLPRIGIPPGTEGENPAHTPNPDAEEKASAKGVLDIASELTRFHTDWKVAALHGKMPSEKRNDILQDFREGKLQVLVATTVIEVGVDIPNANLMVIEGPDRFGLAQLHQLRGRTGRGQVQAWCFLLLPENAGEEVESRLRLFASIEDGFELAEMDLSQRGAGHLDGTVQSGFGGLRWADLIQDAELVEKVRQIVNS